MGTIKTTNIEPIADNGTVTLGSSGDTITIPSGVTITNNGTQTGFGGTNTPAFLAVRTTTLDIANNTWVKVAFNSEILDTDNCYDPTTNYRFTPTTAGYYVFNFNLSFQNYVEAKYLAIRKNGSLVSNLGMAINNSSNISTIAQANGTSDYFEAYVAQASGSSQTIDFSETRNQFSAVKIIGA